MLLLFFLAVCEVNSMNMTEVITTKSGKVRGLIQSSSLPGIRVQKFLNIPYAEAPVDELRFEKPEPRKPWKGILNSSQVNIACFQKYEPGWQMTEDCLILNVWIPYPTPKNASVMVYIHGGSFRSGSSGSKRHNGANFVAVGDVILVTINYRVSALGFFSTGDERMKGNLGHYDQRLAMKWVKENIASFGGNPNSITLFGLSSGAASVSAHTLSKESWPYFDRVLLQSGSMLAPWAMSSEAERKAGVEKFLRSVNCSDDKNILQCLKKNVKQDVLEKIYKSQPFALEGLWYRPSIDRESLTDHPVKLMSSGQFKNSSILLGVTKDEMFFTNDHILQKTRDVNIITGMYKKFIQDFFTGRPAEITKHFFKIYATNCTPNFIEALRPMVDSMTDFAFTCPARQDALVRSKRSHKVFLYRYSYATSVPYSTYPLGQFGFAAHDADFLSSFGQVIKNPRFPTEDQILSQRVILFWTNFAKTGDPNKGRKELPLVLNNVKTLPRWPRHSSDEQEYLDMESLSQMTVRRKLREEFCEFWADPQKVSARALADQSSASKNSPILLVLCLTFLPNLL